MKDCIYREEAIRICERLRDKTDNDDMAFALNWALQSINNISAVDVPEIVTCEQCVYHVDNGYHYCNKWCEPCPDNADFFCAYAELENNDGTT